MHGLMLVCLWKRSAIKVAPNIAYTSLPARDTDEGLKWLRERFATASVVGGTSDTRVVRM